MDASTVMRNVAILEDVLSGKGYAACANKFNISIALVSNCIRATLKLLKEHTDIDIIETSSYSYVMEQKTELKRALALPFPKVSITPSAKTYLKNKFGKYYAQEASKVAAEWETVSSAFNRFNERRDVVSIENWLASEGLMVANVLTNTMLDFALEALQKGLSYIKEEQGECSIAIKKVERMRWNNKLVVYAEIVEKEHAVTRRFSIDLIPH